MTDPDPAAALAEQVKELLGQCARAQSDIRRLRAEFDADSSHTPVLLAAVMQFRPEVEQLHTAVKKLQESLTEALDKHRLKPPPAPWWCVDQAEGEEMLASLRQWVETFFRRHYPGYADRLPRCWANHPEAVWELSTLRAEWDRIYADEDNRDLQGALNWHDKWLPGALSRLSGAIRCDEAGCRVRSPPRP